MKNILEHTFLVLGGGLFLASCGSDSTDKVDDQKPVIVANYAENFPISCTKVKRGENFIFKAKFTDNVELGSYSINIHNNFDHHNHETTISSCVLEAKKTPVKPMYYNQTFSIPSGRNSWEVAQNIAVPEDVDTGDYHFLINVTDKTGWSTLKGISIKIVE